MCPLCIIYKQAQFEFNSVSALKQQSVVRHATSLWHSITLPSQTVFFFFFWWWWFWWWWLILNLSRMSASTTLPSSWFQRRMACGKNYVLYTVVLVCGTRNRSEWPLIWREVPLRWCSAGILTRLYTMRYIITLWAYARLHCTVCHWNCCSMAVTLLVLW